MCELLGGGVWLVGGFVKGSWFLYVLTTACGNLKFTGACCIVSVSEPTKGPLFTGGFGQRVRYIPARRTMGKFLFCTGCPEAISVCLWCVLSSLLSEGLTKGLGGTFLIRLEFLPGLLGKGIWAPHKAFFPSTNRRAYSVLVWTRDSREGLGRRGRGS